MRLSFIIPLLLIGLVSLDAYSEGLSNQDLAPKRSKGYNYTIFQFFIMDVPQQQNDSIRETTARFSLWPLRQEEE